MGDAARLGLGDDRGQLRMGAGSRRHGAGGISRILPGNFRQAPTARGLPAKHRRTGAADGDAKPLAGVARSPDTAFRAFCQVISEKRRPSPVCRQSTGAPARPMGSRSPSLARRSMGANWKTSRVGEAARAWGWAMFAVS